MSVLKLAMSYKKDLERIYKNLMREICKALLWCTYPRSLDEDASG